MLELAYNTVKVAGKAVQSVLFDRIKIYVDYVKHCDDNLSKLLKILEELQMEKDDINAKVLGGKELRKLTGKANRWLVRIRDLTKDQMMKKLMNKDMEIAKVTLRLMKDDLKKLVEMDDEIRDVVVKVMKDVSKRKRIAGNGEVLEAEDKDKEVGLVLEKLMQETMEEFKVLMQNDPDMAVAALHILENHTENLERLTEKDNVVSKIMAKAKKMSVEQEWLSDDNHDSALVLENTLREKVTNLLKPVAEVILSEELLKALPENVRLGVEVMNVVIGNSKGLKAESTDADNTASHVNCCCCVISYNCFADRHDMSVDAEAMHGKIQKIIQNKPGNEEVTRPTRRDEMKGIPTNCVDLESRNELLGKIVKALGSQDVHALGIFGMGGSGKTTLASEVVSSKAKGIFKTTIMVEISESPNIECIQDQIGNGLDLDLRNVYGIREKAIRLYSILKPEEESEGRKNDYNNSEKTLIVLDNIWNKIDLVQMGIPRECCKLLLTSRTKDICRRMDVQDVDIFEVGLLKKDEAKDLFNFQVQEEIVGEYNALADRLLEKCGGLPLSIVATGNSLKGKKLPFWRQFAEELEKPISCQIIGAHYETFSVLRTSYEFMSSEEKKKFFLLACLSPVGSSISVENLMRYGIGLDLFQHVNKLSEAIEAARTWAEELVSSSMLLKGDSDEYVKIHDVVRESTLSFASKTGLNKDGEMFLVDAIPRWICKETFNKYTGISLLSSANYERLNGVKADLLQILLLKGNGNYSFLEPNFFQGMANLKVLEVSFMNFEKGLPESIGKMKYLKTLHLEACILGDIELIGKLESLLVLSLRGSYLERLPDEIGKLYNLRLLDMSMCRCEQPRIPTSVIARLSLLEGLFLIGSNITEWAVTESIYDTGVNNWANMHELNKLEFLNVLELSMERPIPVPLYAHCFKNLDKFQIHVGQYNFGLRPFQRVLRVSEFDISEELKRENCLEALLKKVDFLSLKSAIIQNIVPELDEEGFGDLIHLELDNIHSISRICEGKAPKKLFSNLRFLQVSELRDLEELLPSNPLPRNLITLQISYCNSLNFIFSENGGSSPSKKDAGVEKESDIIELPCLKRLYLKKVRSLVSVVKSSTIDDSRHQSFFNSKVKLPSLEKLAFFSTESIVKLWGKESNMDSFRNLRGLKICSCEGMESVGPPSMFLSLAQLKSLEIDDCNKMQQVISKEGESQEIPDGIITFPKLNFLRIYTSENFECFYNGSYKIKFPCLKTLRLINLKRMANFGGGGNSTTLFNHKIEFPYLENLLLTTLSSTVLWDLDELKAEGEGEGITSNLVASQLRELNVGGCNELQWLFSGEENQVLELSSLEKVDISNCVAMKSFSTRPLKAPILRDIVLYDCPKMEWLLLGNTNFGADLELSSLECVNITKCPNMKSFSPAILRAPKLQLLTVDDEPYSMPKSEDLNQFLHSTDRS